MASCFRKLSSASSSEDEQGSPDIGQVMEILGYRQKEDGQWSWATVSEESLPPVDELDSSKIRWSSEELRCSTPKPRFVRIVRRIIGAFKRR